MDFMQWLRREWEEENNLEIQGEYWIDDSGNATFADGDIGDANHVGIAIDSLRCELAGDRYENGSGIDWEKYVQDLAEEIYQERRARTSPNQQAALDAAFENNPMSFLDQASLKTHGIDPEAFHYACGNGDARDYAMKHWRWKRVHGNSVETWTFDARDRKIISNGIREILYDQDGADDTASDSAEVYIYVHSNGQSFDMTLAELDGKAIQPATPPRPVNADIGLHQAAAHNYTRTQDTRSMPAFYKGKLGDWYIPRF